SGGLAKGSLVIVEDNSPWNASYGAVTDGNIQLSQDGDQILAYQGESSAPTFIATITFDDPSWQTSDPITTNETFLPSGLTDLINAVAIPEMDNGVYGGPSSGTSDFLRSAINNPANWQTSNTLSLTWPSSDFTVGNTIIIGNDNATVDFADTITLENLQLNLLEILTINNDGNLIINGTFLNEGTIYVRSDALNTGSLICNSVSGSGTANVERYITSNNWHIISSAVSNQQLGAFASLGGNAINEYANDDYDLAPYNELTDSWSPYTASGNTNIMGVAKGYVLKRTVAGLVTFSGTLNSGEPGISISRNNYGWNAVGNPYPSTIIGTGTDGFLNANSSNLDPAYAGLYIWDYSSNDYLVYTNAAAENIDLGQGFIVKSKTDGATVNYTPSMQVYSNGTSFKSEERPWPTLKLLVANGDMINETTVSFNNQMSNGLDFSYDAGKLKGNRNFALYTRLIDDIGIDFAMQALPDIYSDSLRIPVGLDFASGGEVIFSAETINLPLGVQVVLEDFKTKSFVRLDLEGTNYVTNVDAGTKGAGRFFLLTNMLETTESSVIPKKSFFVFTRNKAIIINGLANHQTRFALYGVDGKLWYKNKAENLNRNLIDGTKFPAGVYFLRIIHQGKIQLEKLLLVQ
ncbi:MAG: T9SS type A sorting domain-containing protein, partial [Prolixibacteraceae bacterium]|nr:T9SS type A sorting domain-containing protein [Prolixibacteraceae bacterium]